MKMKPIKKNLVIKVFVVIVYTLLIWAIVVFASGCNRMIIDPITMHIIDEGSHKSYFHSFNNKKRENVVSPILLTGKRLEWDFRFEDYHKYDYTVKNGGDINKLYGITSTDIHGNSARIGWRYIGNDMFEVYAYYYIRGVRGWELIDTIPIHKITRYIVDVSHHTYIFSANDKWINIENTKNILAARSMPYFGGDNTAPHKMYFKIVER